MISRKVPSSRVTGLNITFDKNLDKKGGVTTQTAAQKSTLDVINGILNSFQLNDVWRMKNPRQKRFSWRQKTPPIHCRLDYWLISDSLFDSVEDVHILPAFKSDHSPVTLHLTSIKSQKRVEACGN